jgi:hypothetical protein
MRLFSLASLALALPLLSGCTLVLNDKIDPLQEDPLLDLQLQLVAFNPHIGQITDVWLVDDQSRVQARAIFDGLDRADQLVVLENVVSLESPVIRRVDFYSDLNESITPGSRIEPDAPVPDPESPDRLLFPDHMWRVELDDTGFAEFMHSTNFVNIVDPTDEARATFFLSDLHLVITGTQEQDGLPAEVRVYDATGAQERQIGLYALRAVDGDALDITLGGILDEGTEYRVELSFDNGNAFCTRASGAGTVITVEASLASLSPCSTDASTE